MGRMHRYAPECLTVCEVTDLLLNIWGCRQKGPGSGPAALRPCPGSVSFTSQRGKRGSADTCWAPNPLLQHPTTRTSVSQKGQPRCWKTAHGDRRESHRPLACRARSGSGVAGQCGILGPGWREAARVPGGEAVPQA